MAQTPRKMTIRYSPGVDALYVHLGDGAVDRTEDLGELRHVDYAADGTVIGVEILGPRARGVDLRGVPDATSIGEELRRLGFQVLTAEQPVA